MPVPRTSSILGVLGAASLAACGSSSHAGASPGHGGEGGDGTTSTASHHAYSDDANLSDMEAFLQELATTSYWGEVTSEYGVGALRVLPTIMQTGTAPATLTDAQIRAALAANTTGASPAWGQADPGTIYLFLVPEQTAESAPGAGGSTLEGCTSYDGYHDETAVSAGVTVAYAVGCACPGYDGPTITDIQERTVALSHEIVEAATDPFHYTDPAWAQEDDADFVWTLMTGGEVADMCQFNTDSYDVPPGNTYMVQRSWSNKAAEGGTNPCVPVGTTAPYFNSVPALPDMLALTGTSITTRGVEIPVGASKTIDVDLFSAAPTSGPWSVQLYDGDDALTGTPSLQLSLDTKTGENGDTLHLTIKVLKAGASFGVAPFILSSTLNGQNTLSMGLVGQ